MHFISVAKALLLQDTPVRNAVRVVVGVPTRATRQSAVYSPLAYSLLKAGRPVVVKDDESRVLRVEFPSPWGPAVDPRQKPEPTTIDKGRRAAKEARLLAKEQLRRERKASKLPEQN